MSRLGVFVIVLFLTTSAFAQEAGPRDLEGQAGAIEQPQAQLQRSVIMLYLSDLRNEVGLTEDQFLKAEPVIREFIQRRFRNANQRNNLEKRQGQLLNQPDASPAELQKLNEDFIQLDRQAGNWDTQFVNRLQGELSNRELSLRQIVLLRDFNKRFFNEKLPTLVERIRSENVVKGQQQQQRPAAARADQNRKNPAQQPNGTGNTLRGKNPQPPVQTRPKSTR
jgi:hypothetical protein